MKKVFIFFTIFLYELVLMRAFFLVYLYYIFYGWASGYERGLTSFCSFVKIRVFVGISVNTLILVLRTFVHFYGIFWGFITQFLRIESILSILMRFLREFWKMFLNRIKSMLRNNLICLMRILWIIFVIGMRSIIGMDFVMELN